METQKLIIFDLDGTLTPFSTWEIFNTRLGITPEDDFRLFTLYKEGKLAYKDWTMELISIYKKNGTVTKTDLEEMAGDIALRPEAQAAINSAKSKGYHIVLVSGAIDIVVRAMAARLGIGEWFATNKAIFNDDNELIGIESMGDESPAKLELVKVWCLKSGFDMNEVIAVGDGGNEHDLFKETKGILLGNNAELAPIAWKKVESLSEIESLI